MGYPWRDNANSEGPQRAAKIPKGNGIHLRIAKIVFGKGSEKFASKSGDPQIGIVYQDQEAREAFEMMTLSDKAGWKLAKLMSAFDPPANLARMEEDGVEPGHFADPDFAEANLLNRQLHADVDYDNQGYVLINPIKQAGAENDAPPPAADDAPPSTDDDPPPTAEPKTYTKDEAWSEVVRNWAGAIAMNADRKAERSRKWVEAIKKTGKKEADLTPAEWTKVVEYCAVPF